MCKLATEKIREEVDILVETKMKRGLWEDEKVRLATLNECLDLMAMSPKPGRKKVKA